MGPLLTTSTIVGLPLTLRVKRDPLTTPEIVGLPRSWGQARPVDGVDIAGLLVHGKRYCRSPAQLPGVNRESSTTSDIVGLPLTLRVKQDSSTANVIAGLQLRPERKKGQLEKT